jgi:hypothetical protein
MTKLHRSLIASSAAIGIALAVPAPSHAQMPPGPAVEKTYGQGLPRDRDTLIFDDDQYPVCPLTPEQQAYASINGARMKQHVIDLANMALRYRDAGHKYWGLLPGTTGDRESMEYITNEFERLGLTVEHFPYTIPEYFRPTDWSGSYATADGQTVNLTSVFPIASTKATPPEGVTAEAVWVGIGAAPDFLGRDVKDKVVVIYSVFVPGGRSHSASDRARLWNAETRAVDLGAAAIITIMGVPGNGQFQSMGGKREVPHFSLSQDEGFALRDRLATGEKVVMTLKLEAPPVRDVETAWTVATLPGMSDEQIVVMSHTDGFFEAATDNNAGIASALEIARFYAERPLSERPRTMKFIQFPDHHMGEPSLRAPGHVNEQWPWDKVAVKLTMEHPSQTLLHWYNDSLTGTNAVNAFRWNALGSPAFEQMVFDTLKEYGVSVYAIENGPKNGNFAPSFHIIDHVIYHTTLDAPELVPAVGLERATRAFAAALDRANEMTMEELRGPDFPPEDREGSLIGTQKLTAAGK